MVIFKSMINDENIILPDNEIQNAFVLASKSFEYNEIIRIDNSEEELLIVSQNNSEDKHGNRPGRTGPSAHEITKVS